MFLYSVPLENNQYVNRFLSVIRFSHQLPGEKVIINLWNEVYYHYNVLLSTSNSICLLLLLNINYYHFFFRGNIPGGNISKGETIFSYLQPFPAKGTGYQRMIFILFQQTKEIDYSSIKTVSEK